ncbi:hypothetical protein L1987_07194 [Smallanthus sonchifolius]|uniref:Uncharacterized protein n=1 Tax=Smallanthus sonchifolius TaxID=185202 RepID=A0ACB9K048_9ASTR|nr:hypothetical protein L1987_07194 [Smallanthus sonchifolius]
MFSHDSKPKLSEHSDKQQEEGDVESVDESSEGGDEEAVNDGAEGSDSEDTKSDSSDSDDAPSQAHPRRLKKVTLPESSSKRKRQSTSSEYEPDSDSDAAIQRQIRESINKKRGDRQQQAIPREVEDSSQRQRRKPQLTLDVAVTSIAEEVPVIVTLPLPSVHVAIEALYNLEEGEIDSGDDWDEDDDVVIEFPKGNGEGEYEFEDGEIFEVPSFESQLDTGSVEIANNVEASTEASPADPTPVDPEAQ